MMWLRVREKVPARIAEWLTSVGMVLVGLYLIAWPAAFGRAGLTGFASIAPLQVWIAASLCLGAARIGALILNGHRAEISAPVRCVGSILGVSFYSSIAAGYSLAELPGGPPMATVLALTLMAGDLFSAVRSGGDTYTALREATRRAPKWTGFLR